KPVRLIANTNSDAWRNPDAHAHPDADSNAKSYALTHDHFADRRQRISHARAERRERLIHRALQQQRFGIRRERMEDQRFEQLGNRHDARNDRVWNFNYGAWTLPRDEQQLERV